MTTRLRGPGTVAWKTRYAVRGLKLPAAPPPLKRIRVEPVKKGKRR